MTCNAHTLLFAAFAVIIWLPCWPRYNHPLAVRYFAEQLTGELGRDPSVKTVANLVAQVGSHPLYRSQQCSRRLRLQSSM